MAEGITFEKMGSHRTNDRILEEFSRKTQEYNQRVNKYNEPGSKTPAPTKEELKLTEGDIFILSKQAKQRKDSYEKGEVSYIKVDIKEVKTQFGKGTTYKIKEVKPQEKIPGNSQPVTNPNDIARENEVSREIEEFALPLLEKLRSFVVQKGPITHEEYRELVKGGKIEGVLDMDDFVPAKAKEK